MSSDVILWLNEFLWTGFMPILILGSGIYLTFSLNFIQIRKFNFGVRELIENFSLSGDIASEKGITSFQAFIMSCSAIIGAGNLEGAATAIALGGPGAIFWMWLGGFFSMALVYSETVLSQIIKKHDSDHVTGGPAYYIKAGLGNTKASTFLSFFFGITCILALGFVGNAVQSNAVSVAFLNLFNIPQWITGLVLASISAFMFWGGIKRIVAIVEKVVPVLLGLYILACFLILFFNSEETLEAFKIIFTHAFNRNAAIGGITGLSIREVVRYGLTKPMFSNEAGFGTTANIQALAKSKSPSQQGIISVLAVFTDTFVVLTLTSLVIIISGLYNQGLSGITLAQEAFFSALDVTGYFFITICLLFFAFSSIIVWAYFGEHNLKLIFNNKWITEYRVLVFIFIYLGAVTSTMFLWELSDFLIALMVIPNIFAILKLSSIVKNTTKEFEAQIVEDYDGEDYI